MVTLKNLILKYISVKHINILKRKCHVGINVVFLELIMKLYDVCFMKNIFIATWTCLHRFDLHIIIRWPENVRKVNIVVILYIVIFFWMLYYLILAVDDSLGLLVTLMSLQNMKRNYLNCFVFGLSNFNIIPLLPIMLNFVGQHHTSWFFYTSININGYFQRMYALCKHTISLTNFTSVSICRWNNKSSHL
jgi:phosphotransferase system  glucose/maltose/N-acetylglucosamine-specific IIC component